jgi:hypothetical protein
VAFETGDPNPINALTNADAATEIVTRRSTEVLDFMVQAPCWPGLPYAAPAR